MSPAASKPLSVFKRYFFTILFHRKEIAFVLVLLAVAALWFGSAKGWRPVNWWGDFAEPVISAITFVIAAAFAVIGLYHSWCESLPKRLTVHFVYYHNDDFMKRFKPFAGWDEEKYKTKVKNLNLEKNKRLVVMSCYEATLAYGNDARAWSQQIGSQMNNNRQLSFYPFLGKAKSEIRVIKLKNGKTEKFKLYTIIMYLSVLPECILTGGKYLVWKENFDDSPYNETEEFIKFPDWDPHHERLE
jgi:hypothetical protein